VNQTDSVMTPVKVVMKPAPLWSINRCFSPLQPVLNGDLALTVPKEPPVEPKV
jgi:hypothetical protein